MAAWWPKCTQPVISIGPVAFGPSTQNRSLFFNINVNHIIPWEVSYIITRFSDIKLQHTSMHLTSPTLHTPVTLWQLLPGKGENTLVRSCQWLFVLAVLAVRTSHGVMESQPKRMKIHYDKESVTLSPTSVFSHSAMLCILEELCLSRCLESCCS